MVFSEIRFLVEVVLEDCVVLKPASESFPMEFNATHTRMSVFSASGRRPEC